MKHLLAVVSSVSLSLCAGSAAARGVTPYLPLNLAPEVERQIERVLILAGKPVIRRPIPAALVLEALPAACKRDAMLCAEVRAYLARYMETSGVPLLKVSGSIVGGDSDRVVPNAHGRPNDSAWEVAAAAFYQPSDYLLLNLGGIAYDGRTAATGTTLSLGFEYAQLDIGYRDHWFSPFEHSSFLISTEAPTLPSITLSNYQPISRLGLTYEFFAARMSKQENIRYFDTVTSGRPRLAGVQFGISPGAGFGLAINRVMQYGGGARSAGLSDLLGAFIDNNSVNRGDTAGGEEFGNQIASVTASMAVPANVPFVVRLEYAGEDNSYGGNYRLGDSAITLGLDFPHIGERYDLGFELSEWHNAWYVQGIYPLGLTNEGQVLGHWFGDQRQFADQVGGWSTLLAAGYRTDRGDTWRASYRTLGFVESRRFQREPEFPYAQLHEFSLSYGTGWKGFPVGAKLTVGRDALGESFGRLTGTVDLGLGSSLRLPYRADGQWAVPGDLELHIDVGATSSRVYQIISAPAPDSWTDRRTGHHVALGVRRAVSQRGDLGVQLELDDIDEHDMLSFRLLDYRYRFTPHFAANAFFGVGRYHRDAPAHGWYVGTGLQWRNVIPQWDAGLDARYYDKLSRNRVADTDPDPVIDRPRIHFDVEAVTVYLSRRF